MHAKVLLFLTLIFVGTCTQGHGYEQRLKPQLLSDSSAIRAPFASVSSRNGSTLEDMRSHLQQNGCRQAAITGTIVGPQFTERPDNCGAIIKRIRFQFHNAPNGHISAIQVTYRYSNGQELVGNFWGGTGERIYTMNIDVDRGERIIGVVRRSDELIQQLGFYTNKGHFYGLYGGCTCIGENHNVEGCHLRGITGHYLSHTLTAIGFFCTDI